METVVPHFEEESLQVAFSVHAETSFGDRVYVVGSAHCLGCWQPCSALELATCANTYPRWSGSTSLAFCKSTGYAIEYKFIVVKPDMQVQWEPGHNRLLSRLANTEGDRPEQLAIFGNPQHGVQAHSLLWKQSLAIRELSMASTAAANWDEEYSPTNTSRCCSSVCLFPERIEEEQVKDSDSSDAPQLACAFRAGSWRAAKQGGKCEDAWFHCHSGLGVADGVGQMADYAKYGINAAAYADELMEQAALALCADREETPGQKAQSAMAAAEAAATTYGASTITVAAIEGQTVGTANLGDSGYMLLRPEPWGGMRVAEQSKEMHHGWNRPYQLTRVPQELHDRMGKGCILDSAADAEVEVFEVQPGDLFLCFTDGLSDNLHWYEITRIVDDLLTSGHKEAPSDTSSAASSPETSAESVSAEDVAKALVEAARQRSLDEQADTPFSKNARRHRMELPGGKIDDITVVAAWIDSVEDGSVAPTGPVAMGSLDAPESSRLVQA